MGDHVYNNHEIHELAKIGVSGFFTKELQKSWMFIDTNTILLGGYKDNPSKNIKINFF